MPISRFILLRWYFRLLILYAFLWRVSRMRLRLNPLHADRAGGLGFLEDSTPMFAPVLVAQSMYLAMVLGDRIWHQGARLWDFRYEVLAFVALLMLFVILPLTFFVLRLREAQVRGTRQYGRLASRYANSFDEKWLVANGPQSEPLLGTGDIQSLADFANSYAVVPAMRLVPFSKTMALRLAVVIALPLVPLVFTVVRLDSVLAALVKLVV